MRLLYLKGPECESDLRSIRQLARLATDKRITSVNSTAAAMNVLRKAPLERRFDGIVTSPALGEAAIASLVREILQGGPLIALISVVRDLDHSLRAINAGADAVLLLVNGALANPKETISGLEGRLRKPTSPAPAAPAVAPATKRARVFDLSAIRKLLPHAEPLESITVEVARSVDPELIAAAARLVPQLSSSAPVPGQWELDQIIRGSGNTLIVARAGKTIIGMLTLHTFRATTGIHAWIQDCVVDNRAKGHGISELLMREAVRIGVQQGARTAELTSRPSQPGNGRLYERIGFERRETHLYRRHLTN